MDGNGRRPAAPFSHDSDFHSFMDSVPPFSGENRPMPGGSQQGYSDLLPVNRTNNPYLGGLVGAQFFGNSNQRMMLPPPQPAWLNTTATSDGSTIPPPTVQSSKEQIQPSEDDWTAQKETILKQYRKATLEATMTYMQKNHRFNATKRMYKEKFAEWGFRKNLTKDEVATAMRITKKRKDRETEVRIGGKVVPMRRIQKAYARQFPGGGNEIVNAPTPQDMLDVVVSTPDGVGGGGTTRMKRPRQGVLGWTPSGRPSAYRALESDVLRNNGRGLSLVELQRLRESVIHDEPDESEQRLRDALGGYRHQLAATHPLTMEVAYQLADFYMLHDRAKEAYEVLDWLSEECCARWGPWHCRTLDHYLRAVRSLQSWARGDSGKALSYFIYEGLRDGLDRNEFILVPPWDHVGNGHECGTLDQAVIERVFVDSEDDERVLQQIRLANIWLTGDLYGADNILVNIVQQYKDGPSGRPLLALRAQCCLLKHSIQVVDYSAAEGQVAVARSLLKKLFDDHDTKPTQECLIATLDLAFLHHINDGDEKCEKILSWSMRRLEDLVNTWTGNSMDSAKVRSIQNASVALAFHIRVAVEYQHRFGWGAARSWFERAFSFSLRIFGPHDTRTNILDAAMGKKRFSVEDLVKFEILEAGHNSLLVSSLLC